MKDNKVQKTIEFRQHFKIFSHEDEQIRDDRAIAGKDVVITRDFVSFKLV